MKSKIMMMAIFGLWFSFILGVFIKHSLNYDPFFGTARNLIFRYQARGDILDRKGEILATGTGSARLYPLGTAGTPIIGVARPGIGVDGFIEQKFAERLISNKKSKFWYFLNQSDEGYPLKTTLDKKLQLKAYQAMSGKKGAIVIMKLNGEVLASISIPSYNPNKITLKYNHDSKTPPQELFINKAFDGRFEPGSTWKTVIALALMENGYQDKAVVCHGSLKVGHKTIRCMGSHGVVKTMADAFTKSCNIWFMKTTLAELDADRLKTTFKRFMARKINKDLTEDDVALAAIGQGEVLASPLELAQVAASIGNRGLKPEPRLVRENIKSEKVMDENVARRLSTMMMMVVKRGTAMGLSEFTKKGYFVAAKTGTAERDTPKGRVNTAVLIGLAGHKHEPEIAFSVIVEETEGYGGTVCVPVMKEILDHFFRR